MIWFSGFTKILSRAGLGRYEEREPGKKLKILLAGYNGARNTGADVRVISIAEQVRQIFGDEKVEMTVLSMDRGIPIIGISMDERLTDLLAEAGMDREFLLRTDDIQLEDDINHALKAAEEQSSQIRQKLQDKVRGHKEALHAMGAFLKTYLD